MDPTIVRHTLINAIQHNGQAEFKAVLGRIIAENPQLRSRIKELIPQIQNIINEINSWGLEKQLAQVQTIGITIEKKEVPQGLPALPKAEPGTVVMRLAPYPSGPLHIGNARMVLLNDEYVKRYHGKLLLVMDDTIGSQEKHVIPDAYSLILEGLQWLGVEHSEPIYKSDRLKIFYKYANRLIAENHAYVCDCPRTTMTQNRASGTECPCRDLSVEENLIRWNGMLEGVYREGGAVVRLKTDMQHPNPAFRDRVLLRISERKHPRVGTQYRVWPLLEFSWAIDDHLLGITHILRGKDLIIEDLMEQDIWQKLGWHAPEFIHYGMLRIKEAKLSKSAARQAIEQGKMKSWDDPQTWSLQALRKRGITPDAIRTFIVKMGLSMNDVNLPADILYAENRKLIDSSANRYFAVMNPTQITLNDKVNPSPIYAPRHPDFPVKGQREIPISKVIYIDQRDWQKHNGDTVRLMNYCTVQINENEANVIQNQTEKHPIIQWVSEPHMRIQIMMPDGSIHQAIAEPIIQEVADEEAVQLIRIGFCGANWEDGRLTFYFAHR
jgi:glutamyl-tRNA synthetase